MATTIGEGRDVFTVIFEFDIEPEQEPALREGIQALVSRIVRKQPGFVSANLHVSTDCRKILNYFQWESKEAFESFRADADKQQTIRSVIGPYGPKSRSYEIVFSASPLAG